MKWIGCCGQLCAKACVPAAMRQTKARNSRRLMASLRLSTKLYHIIQIEPRLQRTKFGASTWPSGYKRTSNCRPLMCAIPPKADIGTQPRNVCFVPIPDIGPTYSITLSACASNFGGMVRSSAFAVFRLTTSSNVVGCSTGRFAGFVPCRTLTNRRPACRKI
jgi:hypothetical protein